MEFALNSRVRDGGGGSCRCLDPADIPTCTWYINPMWINIDMEPPIMTYILDLVQAREGCRCHDRLSTPVY